MILRVNKIAILKIVLVVILSIVGIYLLITSIGNIPSRQQPLPMKKPKNYIEPLKNVDLLLDDEIEDEVKGECLVDKYMEIEDENESKLLFCSEKVKELEKSIKEKSTKATVSSDSNNSNEDSLINSFAFKHLNTDVEYNNFNELRDRMELHTYLWRELYGDGLYRAGNSNIKNINDLILNPDSLTGNAKILNILHKKLYPWLYVKYKSPLGLLRSFKGKGIVICTGSFHYRFAHSSVDTIRNVLKSKLPIEIFYAGESDLSLKHREELESYPDVYTTDITQFFDNDILFINGWAIKPFAILASRFEEVILMDADSTYIHDPAEWFEDEGYIEKGALFFKDRTLYAGPHRGSEWLHSWMKDPMEFAKNSRFYNELSSHEIESSTIVINKAKRLLGLLATCKFNERIIRDKVVYQNVFGDKETYWMAFDMAREPFDVMPQPNAYVGEINYGEDIDDPNQKQLCGHIAHTNRNNEIMFWNDHIIKDKHTPKYSNRLLRLEGWLFENLEELEWTETFHCANIKEELKINSFTEKEQAIIKQIVDRELQYKFVLDADTSY